MSLKLTFGAKPCLSLACLEQLGCTLYQRLLPPMDLAGMDFKAAGQLGDSVVTFEGSQGHLGFESLAVLLAHLFHVLLLLS